jgi:hypothetical protein
MQNYRPSASTESRLDYGLELVAGLQLFPETQDLAPGFDQLNTELSQAHDARRAHRAPLVKARVAVRFANFTTDQAIRSCAKAAEIADGGRRGPIFDALFPKGVGPVVAPMGVRQIKPTEDLIDRLAKSKHSAVIPFAAEWTPKLEAALATLTAAAAALEAARATHDDAFRDEVGLRDEHRRRVDRLMGETRAAFPGDRVRQNLVFPVLEEASPPVIQDEPDAPAGEPSVPVSPA